MKRDIVDFHEVAEGHLAIHDRLQNWGRACTSGSPDNGASPMFQGFQSNFSRGDAGIPVAIPVGRQDATRIGAAVAMLPEPHRLGLQWFYVKRSSVAQGRRMLECTAEALNQYVIDGRTMLVNRGV